MYLNWEKILACQDCTTDTYDDHYSEIVKILTLSSPPSQQLSREAEVFKAQKCHSDTYHLYKGQKKVLMVRQAYSFISEFHGESHLAGEAMLDLISKYPIHIQSLYNFVTEFPFTCTVCLNQGLCPGPTISPYWLILESKFDFSLRNVLKEESIEDSLKNLPFKTCQTDSCCKDFYDRQYQICLYIIETKNFPPLPRGEGSLINRNRLKKKAKQLKVVACNFKTNHLWLRDVELRVPMVKQSKQIAQILHGEQAHRPKKYMRQLLFNKQNKIYPHDMKNAINQVFADCLVCNPKTAEGNSDSENSKQGLQAELSSSKFNKTPYVRMGLEKKVEYTKQIMQTEKLREKAGRIKKFLDSLQIWEDPNRYLNRIANDHSISTFAAELAIDNLHWSRTDDDLLEDNISKVPGVIFHNYKEETTTKVMLITTEAMRYNYYRFGEVLQIDYISGVCRRRESSGRHYVVGFFTGQDYAGKPVIFGLSMISTEMSLYHLKSFELFLEAMGNEVMPRVIISPDSRPLSLSLEIFKKKRCCDYECFVNWFYVVEFLKKNAGQELEKEIIIELFCRTMSEPSPAVYQNVMKTIKSQIVSTNIYRQIEKVGEKFCLSRITPSFIGTGMSTRRVEDLYDILEAKLVYQIKIGAFLNNIFRIDKLLADYRAEAVAVPLTRVQIHHQLLCLEDSRKELNKEFCPPEIQAPEISVKGSFVLNNDSQMGSEVQVKGILKNDFDVIESCFALATQWELAELQLASKILHPQNLKELVLNFYKSLPKFLKSSAFNSDHLYYVVTDNKPKNRCAFIVKYFPQHFCWKCNCNLIYFTGIPCPHLIRVVLANNGSLQYYINSRWILPSDDSAAKFESRSHSVPYKVEDRASAHVSLQNPKPSDPSIPSESVLGSMGSSKKNPSRNTLFQEQGAHLREPELHEAERVPNFRKLMRECTEEILEQDRFKAVPQMESQSGSFSDGGEGGEIQDNKGSFEDLEKEEYYSSNIYGKCSRSLLLPEDVDGLNEAQREQTGAMKAEEDDEDEDYYRNSRIKKLDSDSDESSIHERRIENSYNLEAPADEKEIEYNLQEKRQDSF